MIHINKILENKELVIQNLAKRNFDYTEDINFVYDKELNRRNLQKEADDLKNQFNI